MVLCFDCHSFVFSRSSKGDVVKWDTSDLIIPIRLKIDNKSNISESILSSILNISINNWNGNSAANIVYAGTTNEVGENQINEVYFTNDPTIFTGTGVAAITQMSFDAATGKTINADILINNNISFSSASSSSNYIGNVLSHELGHLLGLGHSQVKYSTMFYRLMIGQNTLSPDDKMGAYSLYPNSVSKGTIKGKVIGGETLIGILGAHVQFVSLNSGKVAGAVVTDDNGTFVADGLDLNDQYFLYVEPIKNLGVFPEYFKSARYDFCNSRREMRGQFFQTCFKSDEGYPQGVSFSSGNNVVELGLVSIGCNLSVSPDYFSNKNGLVHQLDMVDGNGNVGEALVGFFSKETLNQSTSLINSGGDNSMNEDYYEMDLSGFNVPNSNHFLDVKITMASLYSPLQLYLNVSNQNGVVLSVNSGTNDANLILDSDGNPNLEFLVRIPLTAGKSPNNFFTLRLTPKNIEFDKFSIFTKDRFFPDFDQNIDPLNFYLLTSNLSELVSGNYIVRSKRDYGILTDNKECAEGPMTFKVVPNISRSTVGSTNRNLKNEDQGPISCGIIDDGNNSGGGPMGLLIGFMMVHLFLTFLRKSNFKKV